MNSLSVNSRLLNSDRNELDFFFIFFKNNSGTFIRDDFLVSNMPLLHPICCLIYFPSDALFGIGKSRYSDGLNALKPWPIRFSSGWEADMTSRAPSLPFPHSSRIFTNDEKTLCVVLKWRVQLLLHEYVQLNPAILNSREKRIIVGKDRCLK